MFLDGWRFPLSRSGSLLIPSPTATRGNLSEHFKSMILPFRMNAQAVRLALSRFLSSKLPSLEPRKPMGLAAFPKLRVSILLICGLWAAAGSTGHAAPPTVTTPTSTSITTTGATLGGNVTSDGGSAITERGVVYSSTATNANPLIDGIGVTKVTAGGTTGVFTAAVTGLTEGTDYSYNAYATNSEGTSYTSVATFSTLSTNADLSALTLSSGTLSPDFASGTTSYTASVGNATTSITVTPTLDQANATIEARVNGGSYAAVTSGSASGALSLNVGGNTVDVRVTAQDGTTQKTYTVTVTRLSPPTDITLTPSSIGENNTAGDTVGTLAATDPDAGDTHTFTLVAGTGDTDNASFTIVGDSLKLDESADFETKSSYSLRVQAEDAGGATFEKALTVTITDANEAPTALDLSATSINENVAANTTVGTLSTTDPDAGNTHTYTLVAGAGDTDNASFNVSGSALRISASPDFETKSSYDIRVRTTDQGSLSFEETFTITVDNLNEAPTNVTLTPSSIGENNTAGDTVGTLAASDPDAGDTHTFTLVAGTGDTDNASFTIVGDSLQLDVSADFETKSSYSLRVQAEDGDGATFEKVLTVTITDVDEAPTALDLSATSINENVAANTTVGTLSTTDPDAAATHTYTLVAGAGDTDNASFNVSGSALRISASPDFETKSSYDIRVRTTNQANGSLFFEETFTITINDLNDAPAISGGPVALPAVYDYEPATVVALADVLTDPNVTYLDQDAGADAGVAVVGTAGAGLWEYSADGVSWTAIGVVGNASALLLPDSYSLRYTADYPGPDGGETASLTLRAWDQTSGTAGTLANATTQGGSSAFSTGTLLLSLQVQEDDRAPTVTDVVINEVSDYAVFEVTAVAEQRLLLSLGQDSDPATANATVAAFTLETLNPAATAWVAHDPADSVEVPAGGTLLVRVGTATEQDDAFEGSEVFTLVAEALSGASNSGTGTIRDDDEGAVFLASNLTATANDPVDPGYPVLDDDVVKFIQWGEAGSLADDSRMDATLATADAVYPLLFEGMGQGLFDVSLEASGFSATGLKLIAGQPSWSLTGASSGNLAEVRFRFHKPGSTTEFKYLKNVVFRFEDAEVGEQFSGFSYWDGAGTKVTVPWNDSSVFTYSHTPTFSNSNTTVENGAPPASLTQAGKWIQVDLRGRQVTGIEFSHRKRASSAGSVVMTHLAGELAPGALDFGGVFSPLYVGAVPGSQAEIPDYRSQATWSGGAPATVSQTPAPGTFLPLGVHAVALTLDPGAGVVARQGFDIIVGNLASVDATPTVTEVTETGATLGGTVSSLGSGTAQDRGVVYSVLGTNADPLIGGTGVTKVTRSGGKGTFTSAVSGLSAATTYAFKAYVTTLYGTTYSNTRVFTTGTSLTFSSGLASVTNRLVRPGESQVFTFNVANSSAAIFSGSGATAGLQWTLFGPFGAMVQSGSGNINFSRALAWGNYRLLVTNPGTTEETFSSTIDISFPADPQPDISVGLDATASSGIDIHGPASSSQFALGVSRRAVPRDIHFRIDNDGTLADSMRISGPGSDSRFRISYKLVGKNVTAGVIAGTAATPVIDTNDAPISLSARILPNRSNPLIMDRVTINGRRTLVWGTQSFGPKYVTVTASTDADRTDTATFKVDATP